MPIILGRTRLHGKSFLPVRKEKVVGWLLHAVPGIHAEKVQNFMAICGQFDQTEIPISALHGLIC